MSRKYIPNFVIVIATTLSLAIGLLGKPSLDVSSLIEPTHLVNNDAGDPTGV